MRGLATTLSIAALAISLGACSKASENADNVAAIENLADNMDADANAMDSATIAMAGQQFADMAAGSDAFEIESSKLALQKSKSDAVKKFAQEMIDAHTKSSATLKTAASAATPPITPDEAIPPAKQGQLDAIGSAADFDSAYITAQVSAHEEALAMLQSYAAGGDVASLKAFAAETAPIVSGHLDHARRLKSGS